MARKKTYQGKYLRTTFTFNNKRYYVYGRTQQELIDNEVKKRKTLEAGQEALYNPTLNTYYDHFTDIRRKELSESTLRAQKSQYKLISGVTMANNLTFGEMHIKEITRRDIEYTRQVLSEAGKTPENLNICYAHLNHVFNNAYLDDTIPKNPCKVLKPLKRIAAPIRDTKHRALSVEETIKFFEVAQERNSYYINILKLMLKTGLRVGEACALFLTDIDKTSGFLHVRRTITRDEAGCYVIGEETKTKSGKRDIPLTSDMIDIINDQAELNRIVFGFNWSGQLFKSIDGSLLREYTINREIKRICKQAGIEYFTCHAFRNTFATRFIEQRPQDYKILSEILGHKDISITLNLYTHVMTDNKIKAMNDISILTNAG